MATPSNPPSALPPNPSPYPRLLSPPFHTANTSASLPAPTIAALNARFLQLHLHTPSPPLPPNPLHELSALCATNLNPTGLARALEESLDTHGAAGLLGLAGDVRAGIAEWLSRGGGGGRKRKRGAR